MAGRNRSKETINALLAGPGLAPPREEERPKPSPRRREPAPAPESTPALPPRQQVPVAEEDPSRPGHLSSVAVDHGTSPEAPSRRGHPDVDEGEWAEPAELEQFDFDTAQTIVRRRRRATPTYQTLRVTKNTSQVMRQAWLMNRRVDPAMTFTEFATLVTQRGLQALAEDRERER